MKKCKKLISLLSVMTFLVMALTPLTVLAADNITFTVLPSAGDGIKPASSHDLVRMFDTVTVTPTNAVVKDPKNATVTTTEGKFNPLMPGTYKITSDGYTPLDLKVYWRVADTISGTTQPVPNAWVAKYIQTAASYTVGSTMPGFPTGESGAKQWVATTAAFPGSDVGDNGEPLETDDLWTFTQGVVTDTTSNGTLSTDPVKSWWDTAAEDASKVITSSEETFRPTAAQLATWNLTPPGPWYIACKIDDEGCSEIYGWKVDVKAATITLSSADPASIAIGDDSTVTAELTNVPAGAKIVWKSGTTAVAASPAETTELTTTSTSETATVTGLTAGTTRITAELQDSAGNKLAEDTTGVPITVKAPVATVDPTTVSVFVDDNAQIAAKLTGPNGEITEGVTWSGAVSGDTGIATVTMDGAVITVAGVAEGETTITGLKATYKEHDYTVSGSITVKVVPGGDLTVAIDPSSTSVAVNDTATLSAVVTPAVPSNATYTWSIADGTEKIQIEGDADGSTVVIKGLQAGSGAQVSLTVTSGSKTYGPATASITVTPRAEASAPQSPSDSTSSVVSPSPEGTASASAGQQPNGTASTVPTLPAAADASSGNSPAPSAEPSAQPSSSPSAEPSSSASGEPSSEPSGSESAEPTSSTSTEPSGQPSAEPNTPADEVPIEPAEDAPVDFEISDNPDGSGSVLTGMDVATDNAQAGANAVENLIDSIQAPDGMLVEVVDQDGEPVDMGDPVATGMIVRIVDEYGNVVSTTAVVVKGDVLGTGEMSLTQLVRTAAAFRGEEPLTGAFLMAGDLAGDDGVITLTDLVRMAALFRAFTEGE